MKVFLGIDPGNTGALVWLREDGLVLDVQDMPVLKIKTGKTIKNRLSPQLLSDMLRSFPAESGTLFAYVEQVGAMPKQGVSSTFNFGMSYGMILGCLSALDIPFHTITPAHWKRLVGLRGGKGASRALAAQLYPDRAGMFARVKDDGRAEALLIARAGAHTHH